jgi:hypothetical protein
MTVTAPAAYTGGCRGSAQTVKGKKKKIKTTIMIPHISRGGLMLFTSGYIIRTLNPGCKFMGLG